MGSDCGLASYRTFIFGVLNQSFFPNGVVYEGVSDEARFPRGESGANDSMVRRPKVLAFGRHG
jgi:hypothetical protein